MSDVWQYWRKAGASFSQWGRVEGQDLKGQKDETLANVGKMQALCQAKPKEVKEVMAAAPECSVAPYWQAVRRAFGQGRDPGSPRERD